MGAVSRSPHLEKWGGERWGSGEPLTPPPHFYMGCGVWWGASLGHPHLAIADLQAEVAADSLLDGDSPALRCQRRECIPCPACTCLPCAAGDRCQPVGMMEGPQVPPPPLKYFTSWGAGTVRGSRRNNFPLGRFPGNKFKLYNNFIALARFRLVRSNLNLANQTREKTPITHWKEWEKRTNDFGNYNCNRVETAGCLETNRRFSKQSAAIRCARPADRCRGAAHAGLTCPVHGCGDHRDQWDARGADADGLLAQPAQAVLADGRKAGPQHQGSGLSAAARDLGLSRGAGRRAIKGAAHG